MEQNERIEQVEQIEQTKPKTLAEKLQSAIPVFYYRVPECPACGSERTGRFLKYHGEYETNWAITESLKKGEIVDVSTEPPDENLFCGDCGFSWEGNADLKIISVYSRNQEKKKRHTGEMLDEMIASQNENKTEKRENFFVKHIKHFIGHP